MWLLCHALDTCIWYQCSSYMILFKHQALWITECAYWSRCINIAWFIGAQITWICGINHLIDWFISRNASSCLTHWGLVIPYGIIDLGHPWFRYWLSPVFRHQAISWTFCKHFQMHLFIENLGILIQILLKLASKGLFDDKPMLV